ncbi:MAG: LAGLIDADG family homing endonuclease, partial [Candidatus Micrarchaeota archaeon]
FCMIMKFRHLGFPKAFLGESEKIKCMEKDGYDLTKLSGLGLRIKDEKVCAAIKEFKGRRAANNFVEEYGLNISDSTLNNWLSSKYCIPLDAVIKILGSNVIEEFQVDRLYSGRLSGHCSAKLPTEPSIQLMYLIGATIGDGSLRHQEGKSFFISFEMKDKEIMSIIQKMFYMVFDLRRPITIVRRKDGRETYLLKYSNKVVYYFLQKFFELGPRKTKTVGISRIDRLDKDEALSLLLGLYHTDGSVSKGNLRYYTSSKRLAADIRNLLSNLGYTNREYQYQRREYSPEYQILVGDSKKLLTELERIERELTQKSI